jgi:tetratricopeptide (TPR) repeat protein
MALKYAPNLRAYLGLGIMMQKKKKFEESVKLLKEGIRHFPQNELLHICLGISYMNLGKIGEAISCFQKFPFSEQAKNYLLECKRLLNQI